jgi:hypothetical protein
MARRRPHLLLRSAVAAAVIAGLAAGAAGATAPASDVTWRPATYPAQGQQSPVQTATLVANGATAYVARIDPSRARLALYPGLQEPPAGSPRGPAEVPHGQRWRLLATFNGGFKERAGAGGFAVNGRVYAPLVRGDGTLVEYRNGTVAILNWHGRTSVDNLVFARQNLPPLVWNHRPNAAVDNAARWGRTLGSAATWRTAIGVTATGDVVYAAAGGQTPASLAALMIRLGADRAIELDINPEWPSFIAYGHRGGRDPLAVVPNPQQSWYRYLVPDNRDFFAVYTRAGGGPAVPFR